MNTNDFPEKIWMKLLENEKATAVLCNKVDNINLQVIGLRESKDSHSLALDEHSAFINKMIGGVRVIAVSTTFTFLFMLYNFLKDM